MRCKKHPCDLSSTVGVCASCLRERLSALIAAQAQADALHHPSHLPRSHSRAAVDDCRKLDYLPPPPPPLLFPRSVSPYVARRKSDHEPPSWSHVRFYSTPQVGPTYNASFSGVASSAFPAAGRSCDKKRGRFSLFSRMFMSRSATLNSDPAASSDPPSASPSWFSAILPGHRKKQSRLFSMEFSGPIGCAHRRTTGRGMSPVRTEDVDGDCEECDRSQSGSGCSSDSSHGQKKTPVVARKGKAAGGLARNASGFAFCLSPLVRASPNHQWKHSSKGGLPPDMSFQGEARGPAKPHLTTAASFCKNRSRKFADFGRVIRNR